MKRNLLKKPSGLVGGAYPRERQRVTQSLTVSSHSVRENPGGTGNGPVSPPIATSAQAHWPPSSSKVLGIEQGARILRICRDVDERVAIKRCSEEGLKGEGWNASVCFWTVDLSCDQDALSRIRGFCWPSSLSWSFFVVKLALKCRGHMNHECASFASRFIPGHLDPLVIIVVGLLRYTQHVGNVGKK